MKIMLALMSGLYLYLHVCIFVNILKTEIDRENSKNQLFLCLGTIMAEFTMKQLLI